MWRELGGERDRVVAVLERSVFTDDPVSTLAGVHFNIQKLSAALTDIQHQTPVLELFLERGRELIPRAEPGSKARLQADADAISERWQALVSRWVICY